MAITSVGKNRVYASIQDLPENQSLVDGDRILIQTDDGTALVDYANIKIDIAHTTFETQFTNMVSFTSTVTAFIEQMESQFLSMQEETTQIKNSITALQEKMDCVKLMLMFMMGSVDGTNDTEIRKYVNSQLTGQGLQMYDDCIVAMDNKLGGQGSYSFNTFNLTR